MYKFIYVGMIYMSWVIGQQGKKNISPAVRERVLNKSYVGQLIGLKHTKKGFFFI